MKSLRRKRRTKKEEEKQNKKEEKKKDAQSHLSIHTHTINQITTITSHVKSVFYSHIREKKFIISTNSFSSQRFFKLDIVFKVAVENNGKKLQYYLC